jgi:hypothetical protein
VNTTQTRTLLVVAALLAAFIVMFELDDPAPQPDAGLPERLFPAFLPGDVTSLELTRTNLAVHAQRTNAAWLLTAPVKYPAHPTPIEGLLRVCAQLRPQMRLPSAAGDGLKQFGLDAPQAVFAFRAGAVQHELRIGNRSPVGNQVYVQVRSVPGIAAVDATLLEILPRSADDWRERVLLQPGATAFDGLRVRVGTRNLVFDRDPTNHVWRIPNPPPAKRADTPRVEQLLKDLQTWPVQAFLSDDPRADLASFGLAAPGAELAFTRGSNDVLVVQFGLSPTNAPDLVFARRLAHTNVVAVPRALLDRLGAPYWDWCDAHLVDSLPPTSYDLLEVRGADGFLAQRSTNDTWRILSPTNIAADPEAMQDLLARLASLQAVELAKEVVTDFKSFGLDPPLRRIAFLRSSTNAAGAPTNLPVAHLDIGFNELQGTNRTENMFARRHDENFAYTVHGLEVERMPMAFWQVRDKQVWSFQTSQVLSLDVTYQGRPLKLARESPKVWKAGDAALDEAVSAALEETAQRLGSLRADRWVGRGAAELQRRNFIAGQHKINVTFTDGGGTNLVSLAFGPMSPRGPLAAVNLDGQPVVFVFPSRIYAEFILRYLVVP